MSKVIALIHPEKPIPQKIYDEVELLKDQEVLELLDICEVEVKANGKIRFEESRQDPSSGGKHALFLPAFVGLIFFHSDRALHEPVRKILAALKLDTDFVKVVTTEVSAQDAILFLLLRQADGEKVISSLSRYGGHGVELSLSDAQEESLRSLFRGQENRASESPLSF
jgi:uncharacterized membrane protein